MCILRGCMPSKTLLATASRASLVRSAAEFGVNASFSHVDGAAMQARKRLLIDDFAGYRRSQLEAGCFAFLRGSARFLDQHTLQVVSSDKTTTVRSKTFLIATGSVIDPPHIQGLEETGFLDSDRMLEAEHIPTTVTVLGGGAIALEAATFYAGVGAKVTLLQRSPRVLKNLDPDVSDAVATGMRHSGVIVETGVRVRSVRREPRGKVVEYERDGCVFSAVSEEIVCALGRAAATDGLGLSAVGVELCSGRIVAGTTQQTSAPHIFAAGDVCGPLEVVHIAIQQGEVAARNAERLLRGASAPLEEMDYRLKLFAVFSEPGVAAVGMTEAEAASAGIPVLTASYPFADHGKSMVEGHLNGFVKLMVHAETRRILGGAVVGPQAAELIHEVATAMFFNASAGDLSRVPHYHPTLSEIWTYPAEELS